MSPTPPVAVVPHVHEPSRTLVSWAAIIGGVLTASATYFALSELCLACGLALYDPFAQEGAGEAGNVAVGTIIAGLIALIAALFFGGWIAGRIANTASWFVGGVHGLLVWATCSMLATALMVSMAGMVASGAVKAVGSGIGTVASTAAQALPEIAKVSAPNWDTIKTEVQESVRNFSNDPNKPAANLSQRTRLMELLGSAFSLDRNQQMTANERQELTTLLSSQTGMASDEAARTLEQWTRSWNSAVERFNAVKFEATEEAKQAALVAKRRTAQAAGAGFALMVIGAIAAFFGAAYGHVCRTGHPKEPRASSTTVGGTQQPVSA